MEFKLFAYFIMEFYFHNNWVFCLFFNTLDKAKIASSTQSIN